jgi:hypothetical protein
MRDGKNAWEMIVLYPLLLLLATFVILTAPRGLRRGRGCRWFWTWAAAGALFMFSFLSAFSIGLFLLPFAAALLLIVAAISPHAAEQTGFALGVGSALLLVAYIQRGGEHHDPLPWLAGGLALSAAAIVTYAVAAHARRI